MLRIASDIALMILCLALATGIAAKGSYREQKYKSQKSEVVKTVDIAGEVLVHKKRKVSPGLNFFASEKHTTVYLVNMEGNEVRRWTLDPEKLLTWEERWRKPEIFHVERLTKDELLVIFTDLALLKVNSQGKLIWKQTGKYHHDIALAKDGTIYALLRKEREVSQRSTKTSILDDFIVEISAAGELLAEYSLFDAVKEYIPDSALSEAAIYSKKRRKKGERLLNDSAADVMHTNSMELIQKDLPGLASAGDFLVSMRVPNLVAILNVKRAELKWSLKDQTIGQHDATLTPRGNILIFDNGMHRGYSRVIEVEPKSKSIVWSYGTKNKEIFSPYRSGAQRLQNGNTLITSRDEGRLLEVTPDKEIVWEYKKSSNAFDDHRIYRAKRLKFD